MQRRSIWYALLVASLILSVNAIAAGDDAVVILSCGTATGVGGPCPPCMPPPNDGINIASFSASLSFGQRPASLVVGDSCAAAISDLAGAGFKVVNVAPVGAGFGASSSVSTQAQITYTLLRAKQKE
jgi:hypothetical protein